MAELLPLKVNPFRLTLLHSEWPKFYRILAILSAIGLRFIWSKKFEDFQLKMAEWLPLEMNPFTITLLHSERPKFYSFGCSECNRVKVYLEQEILRIFN